MPTLPMSCSGAAWPISSIGLFVQAQLPGNDLRVAAHADHVPPRLVVAELRRPGQAMDQFQPRGGQFGGPATDLLLQIPA